MNPKKTKSGKYHVSAYLGTVNGKKIFKSITADTRRECIMKATEYINNNPVDGSDLTVGQAVRKYIESKEKILSPSTINGYYKILRYHYPPIAHKRLEDFGNYDFQAFIGSIDASPKTVRNVYGLLRSALRMFSNRNYNITLPEKTEPKRPVATEEDIRQLLSAADPELKKAIILGSCSMRRGEVAAVKYSDIEGTSIFVHADIVKDRFNNYVYKDSAKTPTSTRLIEVSESVIQALGEGEGYIVQLRNPDIITKRFTRLRDSLGINVSFHSLRRFYASVSHALGIPNEYIMKQGGWKNESVMIQSYRQTLSTREKEYSEKIAQTVGNLL